MTNILPIPLYDSVNHLVQLQTDFYYTWKRRIPFKYMLLLKPYFAAKLPNSTHFFVRFDSFMQVL